MFSYSQSGYLSEQHHLQLTGRKLFLALILKVQFCPFCSLVSVFAAKLGQIQKLFCCSLNHIFIDIYCESTLGVQQRSSDGVFMGKRAEM